MNEKKKRGRPHAGRVYTETLGVCLTAEESEKLNNAHKAYNKDNGVKISKSMFVRLHLKDVIG